MLTGGFCDTMRVSALLCGYLILLTLDCSDWAVPNPADRCCSFQGPLARFGDTAANAGILALLASVSWPVLIKTVAASLASAAFRMVLTPIDTLKTTQQTRGGKAGLTLLRQRIRENGVQCLWWGALATAAATFVGHCQ